MKSHILPSRMIKIFIVLASNVNMYLHITCLLSRQLTLNIIIPHCEEKNVLRTQAPIKVNIIYYFSIPFSYAHLQESHRRLQL